MKISNAWVVLGILGWLGCGTPDEKEPPLGNTTDERPKAIALAGNDSCDTAERCGDIGAGKSFTSRQACVTNRETFWSDKWPAAQCEEKIREDKLETCREALRTLLCKNLTDELKTYNTVCALSEVCSG